MRKAAIRHEIQTSHLSIWQLLFRIPEWHMVIVRLGLDGSAGDRVWSEFLAKVGEALK